jgi:TldD protein
MSDFREVGYADLLTVGDFADVYLEESKNLSLQWEEGRIDFVGQSESAGLGLRYLKGLETRFGHATLSHPFSGSQNIDEKSRLSDLKRQLSYGLPTQSLTLWKPLVFKAHPVSKSPIGFSLEKKMALLERAFRAANSGPHVRQVSITYGEKMKNVGYLNSLGDGFQEERTYLVFAVMVTVERNGDLQTAYEALGGVTGFEMFDETSVESLARMVCDRAHKKLYAPQAPIGEMPVVIASTAGGTLIHEAIGHSLEADAVLEGTSPAYVGKIGQKVGDEKLVVYDDPTVPSKRGSFYFDDEGVASESTKLIDHGILRNYLYDRLSARKGGVVSNGHGRRESFAHRPIPRMSNTFVAPGPDNPNEILDGFKNGLLVTKMGGGQVNTANGDFVFEVEEGFRVQNGERTMVRGATLLGNGPQVLRDIDHIGTDHGWAVGTCGKEGQGVPVSDALPTVHIKKMVIGGQ